MTHLCSDFMWMLNFSSTFKRTPGFLNVVFNNKLKLDIPKSETNRFILYQKFFL